MVEGKLNLFSDMLIYMVLYNVFFNIGGIVYIYLLWVVVYVVV